ncbi:hypothetical protein ACFVDT_07210 [Streptomyces sp. NPDC057699]|uniref:hypothetical protein n=1 Tax=Streptomyces sp. NPDC057699 TaxID=3346220 RepID=UPI00367E70DD
MNARRVNAAAGVILAAQKTKQTAAGIAASLEAAGLLQSPESAAELIRLRARVALLPAEVLAEVVGASIRDFDRDVWDDTRIEALRTALFEYRDRTEAPVESLLGRLSDPGVEEALLVQIMQDDDERPAPRDLRPGTAAARRMIRDRQTTEDPHDSPLHRTYETGHDLPTGGAL